MNKLNKKGFTLIEMLVVIAIIAVLVSIIVPVVGNSTTKAKAAADAANLRSIAATAAIDYLDNGNLDDTYELDCETYPGAVLNVEAVDGEIVATFGSYGVDHFADIAQSGEGVDTTFDPDAEEEEEEQPTT